jgi:copper chaperone NosL
VLHPGVWYNNSMTKTSLVSILVCLVLTFSGGMEAAERKPVKPSQKDKCPVCGMFVSKYPDFLAEVLFKDGSYAVFDGAKDMFKYYFSIEKYKPSGKLSDIDALYVTDYYSLSMIDGFNAYYVVGSDIYGPMGKELIPFEKEDDAKVFKKDHKGRSIFRFRDITRDIMKTLE